MWDWDDDNPWKPEKPEKKYYDDWEEDDTDISESHCGDVGCDCDHGHGHDHHHMLYKIIKCLCILKHEIEKCEKLLCNDKFGLKEIKKEVRRIEKGVFSPTFGLSEIKSEISIIQTIVAGIDDEITNPTFGLEEIKSEVSQILDISTEIRNITLDIILNPTFGISEIKSEVSAIESAVFSETFGLEEIKSEVSEILAIVSNIDFPITLLSDIKSEVSAIESAVFSETFGLQEIKSEVSQILANQEEAPFLATGPFLAECIEQTLALCARNYNSVSKMVEICINDNPQDNCPNTVCPNLIQLTIDPCCCAQTEIALPGLGQRFVEIVATNIPNVLYNATTKTGLPNCQGSKVNEFTHADWVPVASFCG